jgi:hypothetical protein
MKVVIHVRPRVSQLVRMLTGRGPEPGEQAAGIAPASRFPQAYAQQSSYVHSPPVCILPAPIGLCAGWSPAGTAGRRMSGTRFWMRLGANGNSAGRILVVPLSRQRWPQALSGNYVWCPRNPRQRPPAAGPIAFEAWRENLLLDSARSASSIARESGIEGSLFELELDLYRAVRLLARRHSRVSESE